MLADFWKPADPSAFKIHFARWNGVIQPLHVLARDMEEWKGWQEHYPGRNDFNRPLIFSVAQVHNEVGRWMFRGIWRVNGIQQAR